MTLADAFGLVLVNHLPAMTPLIHATIARVFPDVNGAVSEFNDKEASFYQVSSPFLRLSAYAMHSKASEKEIADFLAPWSKEMAPSAHVSILIQNKFNNTEGLVFKSNSDDVTVAAHAISAQNAPALRALLSGVSRPLLAIQADKKKVSNRYANQKFTCMDFAASLSCGDVVQSMLEAIEKTEPHVALLDQASTALLSHINTSGLIPESVRKTSADTDLLMGGRPVFDAIMEKGGREYLQSYASLVATMKAYTWQKETTEAERDIWQAARISVMQCENIAEAALLCAHPQAVAECMEIIRNPAIDSKKRAFTKPLSHLSDSMLGRQDFNDFFSAFDREYLNQHLHRDGLELLHEASQKGNFGLATSLVEWGVDPMEKDARGWKAESHFKTKEQKEQWKAYLSSRKAMAAVDDLMAQVSHIAAQAAQP
jgi:hypothetical protein